MKLRRSKKSFWECPSVMEVEVFDTFAAARIPRSPPSSDPQQILPWKSSLKKWWISQLVTFDYHFGHITLLTFEDDRSNGSNGWEDCEVRAISLPGDDSLSGANNLTTEVTFALGASFFSPKTWSSARQSWDLPCFQHESIWTMPI